MILKRLINPKPKIIVFFIVFCFFFVSIPLLNNDVSVLFSHNFYSPYLIFILGLFITFFHGLGLNNLIYEKNIIKKDNLVLGFVYVSLCAPFYNLPSTWLISFILLFYINYLFDNYQKDYPLSETFNATFILSLLTFFYPNIILLIFLIVITGINYNNLTWRIIAVAIIGLTLPYLFYFVYAKINDITYVLPEVNNFQFMKILDYRTWGGAKLIWFGVIFLISLFSFFELFTWLYKKSIRSRKSFIIIIFYFILTLLISLFSADNSWYYMLTPFSIIVGNYFMYTKNRIIANSLFLLLVITSFYYKYMITV